MQSLKTSFIIGTEFGAGMKLDVRDRGQLQRFQQACSQPFSTEFDQYLSFYFIIQNRESRINIGGGTRANSNAGDDDDEG